MPLPNETKEVSPTKDTHFSYEVMRQSVMVNQTKIALYVAFFLALVFTMRSLSGVSGAKPRSRAEYKVVSWDVSQEEWRMKQRDNFIGRKLLADAPPHPSPAPSPPGGWGSKSSFVDVARRNGLSNDDLTTCSYPHRSVYISKQPAILEEIFLPYKGAELPVRDCVLEKLINTIARDRWTLLQAIPESYSTSSYTLYFQRNA